jgi:hypothetical protein
MALERRSELDEKLHKSEILEEEQKKKAEAKKSVSEKELLERAIRLLKIKSKYIIDEDTVRRYLSGEEETPIDWI